MVGESALLYQLLYVCLVTHAISFISNVALNDLILRRMDMPSLLSWRATSRLHYLHVSTALHDMRHRLILPFIQDSQTLFTLLTQFGGLIVGRASLAFVQRELDTPLDTLELAIGNVCFHQFTLCLRSLLHSYSTLENFTVTTAAPSFVALRNITTIAQASLASGRRIVVYESETIAPCSVVAGMWTSALTNFVTAYTFGSAYPRLTFTLRGILSRPRLAAMSPEDVRVFNSLLSSGFELSFSSSEWLQSSQLGTVDSVPATNDCGKSAHACPHQGRFFGDDGSLLVLIDTLTVSRPYLQAQYVAPYGPMAAWRIPNVETCVNDCFNRDALLPPGIVTMLCRVLERDRASRVRFPKRLTFDTASDRLPYTLPPLRHGTRRYSVS